MCDGFQNGRSTVVASQQPPNIGVCVQGGKVHWVLQTDGDKIVVTDTPAPSPPAS